MYDHAETAFNTTYHHHEILVNGRPLRCNDSQITLCVQECKRSFDPIDQKACVDAVEAKWAPYSKCFSGDSTVIVRGRRKPVKMRDLEEGDFVLDFDMKYVEVVGWLHRDESQYAEFTTIQHEFGIIELTSEHLLFDPSIRDYAPASAVTHVQSFYIDGTLIKSQVKDKSRSFSIGIYAPLTTSGSLMVSGVNSSCYAAPESIAMSITQSLGDIATIPYRKFHSLKEYVSIDDYCRSLYNLFSVVII